MTPAEHRTTGRILDIMEQVGKAPHGLSLSEIGRLVTAPKSSIFPLLATLTDRKYLMYKSREQRYFLGENLFILGNCFVQKTDLIDQIRTLLLGASEKTNETLYFGVLSGVDVLYLIKADLYSKFRVMCNPGNKLPAYSTGYGKALLSQFSPQQIQALYPQKDLPPVTENTVKTVDELNIQLESIRETGFSFEKGESNIGIQCIAVPILSEGRIVAGLSFAVPEFRYIETRELQFKELLLQLKQEIETILGKNEGQWNYS
jgi:DNA-binding IclR family transcriptional regulator